MISRPPTSRRVLLALLAGVSTLLAPACLERTTGESKELDPRFLDQIATDKEDAVIAGTGPTFVVKGEVTGEDGIPVDVDIVVSDKDDPGTQTRLGKIVVDGPGPFELTLPADKGDVTLSFFQDMDADGPDEDDNFHRTTVEPVAEGIEGMKVELVLGAYTNPSQDGPAATPPPGDAPAGAPGGPPVPGGGGSADAAVPLMDQEHIERLPEGVQPFGELEGPKVTLRGTISSDRDLLIDLDAALAGDDAQAGKLVVPGPGPFELLVPRNAGSVHLVAYQDIARDGPGALDPIASAEVEVGEVDVDGLELTLEVAGLTDSPLSEGAPTGGSAAPEGSPDGSHVHVEMPPGGPGGGTPPPGAAGGDATPSGADPWADYEGDTVTVAGVVEGEAGTLINIDIRVPDAAAPGGERDLGKIFLDEPGPFSLDVPKDHGDLLLEGFQDPGGDGPDAQDPFASLRVDVRDKDIDGLRMVLVPGARGAGAEHVDVPFTQAAPGEERTVDLATIDMPVTAAGLGPFANHEGDFVKLRGSVRSESELPVDLDVWIADPAAPAGMRNQGKVVLVAPGEFTLRVPKGAGKIALEGYQDEAVDGPTETDAFARVELDVDAADIDDVVLSLKQTGAAAHAAAGAADKGVAPPPDGQVPFADVQGATVTVSGVVRADSDGMIDIDVRVPDADAPGGVRQEGKIRLQGPGVFELKVPVDFGSIELEAFQDTDHNGPDDDDPYARLDVEVGSRDLQASLDLVEGGRAIAASAGAPPHQGATAGSAGAGEGDAFPAYEGERVTISGTIAYDGEGLVDIDLFKSDPEAPGGRSIAGKLKLKPGSFSFTAPKDFGKLELEAFVDVDGDGPSASDPVGRYEDNPLTVGSDDIDGVVVQFDGG